MSVAIDTPSDWRAHYRDVRKRLTTPRPLAPPMPDPPMTDPPLLLLTRLASPATPEIPDGQRLFTRSWKRIAREHVLNRCLANNVAGYDVMGKCRTVKVVQARHEAIYLIKRDLKKSLNQIGAYFGGLDHTTVLHANRRIKALIDAGELVL